MAPHRESVEARLGRKLTAAEFGELAETWAWGDLVAGERDEEMALAECVDEVLSWSSVASADAAVAEEADRTQVAGGAMPAGEVRRLRAKTLALAALASREAAVVAWRENYPLVPLADVDRWEGDRSELERLTEHLAKSYGWDLPQARAFVLADVLPVAPWVRVTTRRDSHRWRERITLDIDPDTPAEVVARIYTETRRDMGRAHRPPDASTLDMLADWAARSFPESLPLRKWSDQYGITQASARRKLSNGWEHLTGVRLSRS